MQGLPRKRKLLEEGDCVETCGKKKRQEFKKVRFRIRNFENRKISEYAGFKKTPNACDLSNL